MSGGFEEYARQIIKGNAQMRGRNSFRKRRQLYADTSPAHFNEQHLSPEERRAIKERVREVIRRQRIRNAWMGAVILLICGVVILAIYHWFFVELDWLKEWL